MKHLLLTIAALLIASLPVKAHATDNQQSIKAENSVKTAHSNPFGRHGRSAMARERILRK